MISTTLLKLNEKNEALEELKEDIEGMKCIICSHSRSVQLLEQLVE